MSEVINIAKSIWDKNWENTPVQNIKSSLNSKFTIEAYKCLKQFVCQEDKKILELGCGTGRFCYLLAKDFLDSEVIGIDISENSIKIANSFKDKINQSNISFQIGNLFNTNFKDSSFDVVYNEGVIEHFRLDDKPNYEDALKEMVRLSKVGGKVIVAVPNWWCLPHTIYKKVIGKRFEYGYEKSFTSKELKRLFVKFGLRDIEITAWYPAHGFYRLEKYSYLFKLLGDVTDNIGNFIDSLTRRAFTNNFGFEILIKGVK